MIRKSPLRMICAAVRDELVCQLEAAENASSEVMRLVSEMVVEKHG